MAALKIERLHNKLTAIAPVGLWTALGREDLPWLSHGVSTRSGGTSDAPFDSLNLGLHVGDNPARVRENRRRLAQAAGFGLADMVCAAQVHGSQVAIVGTTERGRGAADLADALPDADALVTNTPGSLLTLFYADCLPVLFVDPVNRAVGVAHAGWRGLVGGVLENTLAAMQTAYGTDPANVRAAVGPGIGQCCFEVGPEVAAQFGTAYVCAGTNGVPHANLSGEAVHRLEAAGILPTHITVCPECTSCRADRWFSHRRDKGKTGRMAAFVGLRP